MVTRRLGGIHDHIFHYTRKSRKGYHESDIPNIENYVRKFNKTSSQIKHACQC